MVDEESKSDVVKEARALLTKTAPKGKITNGADAYLFDMRGPAILSILCDEVEELRRRNSTQEESIEAALPFVDAMQRCHHNCTPESCSAEGQRRAKQGRVIAARLRKSITPKGSEQ